MSKRLFLFCCLFFLSQLLVKGQAFERLNYLVKERDFLQNAYERINTQVKAAKSKKPSPELQAAYEKLMAKDADIIKEIEIVQTEVARQQKEIAQVPKKEKIKVTSKSDRGQVLLIDSLSNTLAELKAQKDSLLVSSAYIHSDKENIDNELKTTVEEKALVQKELDAVKTDKFILARRNQILLYFNMGVGVLLISALIYTILGFRRKKKTGHLVSVQDLTPSKPRPITGFSQSVPRIAFENMDTRLDKIEKLGKLREKGLLSEEEFLMQKKQILNSKND